MVPGHLRQMLFDVTFEAIEHAQRTGDRDTTLVSDVLAHIGNVIRSEKVEDLAPITEICRQQTLQQFEEGRRRL